MTIIAAVLVGGIVILATSVVRSALCTAANKSFARALDVPADYPYADAYTLRLAAAAAEREANERWDPNHEA